MNKKIIYAAGVLVLGLNAAVYAVAHSATVPTSVETTAAIKGAKWNPTTKISYSGGSVILRPNGIPNHARDKYYALPKSGVIVPTAKTAYVALDPTKAQTYKFTFPTTPKYSATTTSTSLGSIGVMISGTVLYNPFEGDSTTVAMANNFTITDSSGHTASFVDKCAGHPGPGSGAYHYHGLSSCVTSKVDTATGPSHLIGLALDGFPIYGDRNSKGEIVSVSSLDKCNGIFSATPEFPNGVYHYVLPGTADVRSSIACFHGVVDSSQIQKMPAMGGKP